MRALALIALLLWPLTALAQVPATLVADAVTLDGDGRLIAAGNVEVFHDGTRLSAARISYDRAGDLLRIDGPIFIQGPGGEILTADRASLDPRLENGMLLGARLVLERQLQLAAARIDRADGRLTQLSGTAVTSCRVCGTRAPLWEIRAQRVVHDEEARQLYFTNAQLRIRGVPVFWLPRMRLPDPTQTRATGFLTPRIRTSDLLGTGLKLPYFITIGDSRDLLLTPYVSRNTRTLEARYRQAFLAGEIEVRGAFSDDELTEDDQPRSYVFAEGRFDLGRGYKLDFDIEAVSDNAYLLDYGYSDKDRLDSALTLTRVRDDDLLRAGVTYYETLRDDERNATLPPIVTEFAYDLRLRGVAGGTLDLGATGDALVRYGSGVGDLGRDVARFGLSADWQRRWVSAGGIEATALAGLRADHYRMSDAVAFDAAVTRLSPSAGLTLRYPLVKTTATARHLLEPVLALAWSDATGGAIPNEDASRPEFDAGNLLALSQLPGEDRIETGTRAALGLRWRRLGNSGASTQLTFGRLFRETPDPAFTRTSGLGGTASDWLIAGHWAGAEGLRVDGRALLSEDLDTNLAEARVGWRTETLSLDAAYIWQNPDPVIGRDGPVSEWSLDTRIQVTPAWAVRFDTRYDVAVDAPASAGLGVEWRNECVTVDLSVSRRYTSSTTVEPSTDYGLSVELSGFSAGSIRRGPVTSCTK